MPLTNLERETILLFNEAEGTAEITVYSARLKRRLAELALEHPESCKLRREHTDGCMEYTFPKSWVRINPARERQPLTEMQKEQLRERLTSIRSR